MSSRVVTLFAAASALALVSCGGTDYKSMYGCTVVIEPGMEADASHAFVAAAANDVICFTSGTYTFSSQLTLATPNVKVLGVGMTRPVLDFATAAAPQAIDVQSSASAFVMENIEVRNSQGDAVRATGVDGVTFRGVKVDWKDAAGNDRSTIDNGAYALYPVGCHHVLIENCEIVGSRDAGLYVGQSQDIVVRYNSVHGNVAGLEIENSIHAEVYGNDAFDNTAGILIFDLPGMMMLENGRTTHVHDNHSHDNNRENFAMHGSTVSNVPDGLGFMVLASNDTEMDHNMADGNGTAAVLTVSYQTLEALTTATSDTLYDKYLEGLYIHDNTFSNDGRMPSMTSMAVNLILALASVTTLEEQVWDGVLNPADAGMADKANCYQQGTTFRNIDALTAIMGGTPMMSTDVTMHACTHPSQPPVTWDAGAWGPALPAANTTVPH